MFEIEMFIKYKQFILIGLYILIGIVAFLVAMFIDYYEHIKARANASFSEETVYHAGRDTVPFVWFVIGLVWPMMVPICLFIYIACKCEGKFDKWMISKIYPMIKKDK